MELTELVAEVERRGRETWPEIEVSRIALGAHVERIWARGERPDAAQFGGELYLACACARGDELALRRFEERYMPTVARVIARFQLAPADRDEIEQRLRVHLFLGAEPRIADYGARGPLAAWLRTTALRTAARLVAGLRAMADAGDRDAALELVSAADPELAALRDRHRAWFQRALDESILALSPRAKAVLRQHYVDGQNIDTIGAAFGVHRATVARWLAVTRQLILANLRSRLTALQLSPSDLRSLTGALIADLHVSLDRVLGASDGGNPTAVTVGFASRADRR